MRGLGPRILLMGGNYRALCVLERLLDRGERVVAFIGEEGSGERDFCPEILESCDRASIPARSGRKLGEEIVRWLEDRIRPDLAITVGLRTEVPLAIGGNCRLGMIEVIDALRSDERPAVLLRQNGHELLRRELPAPVADSDAAGDLYLQLAEATLLLLDEYLDRIGDRQVRPLVSIPFESAPLGLDDLSLLVERPDPGRATDALERAAEAYLGADRVLALTSTASAFTLALAALGIEHGDEVLVPGIAPRYVLTALRERGAALRLVDVDPRTLTMSPERMREMLTPRTRAAVVSHAFGQPADLPALQAIAREAGIHLLEDAGAAFGASLGASKIGASPSTCTFQLAFAAPSAGCCATLLALPAELEERVLPLSDKLRLCDGAAELALRALARLDADLEVRRRHAQIYGAELGRYDAFQIPASLPERASAWLGYPLRVTAFARTGAEDLSRLLSESGIEARMIAPLACERELCNVPIAERACTTTVVLPVSSGIDDEMRSIILDTIFDYAIG
jgi:dTDP-4-amino-4,6-dideoxygalactose transaminase